MVQNPYHRMAMTRMRISAHRLPIETGRYLKIRRELRECPLGCKSIGDEYHYLTSCKHPFIRDLISPVLDKLQNIDNNFQNLTLREKAIFMLGSKNQNVLKIVAKLCFKIEDQFKSLIY